MKETSLCVGEDEKSPTQQSSTVKVESAQRHKKRTSKVELSKYYAVHAHSPFFKKEKEEYVRIYTFLPQMEKCS